MFFASPAQRKGRGNKQERESEQLLFRNAVVSNNNVFIQAHTAISDYLFKNTESTQSLKENSVM